MIFFLQLIYPYLNIDLKYYDLGIENRDAVIIYYPYPITFSFH